jgi:hypothetical protein
LYIQAPTSYAVLQFLRDLKPSMESLVPKFEAEGFDDEMLRTVTSWPNGDVDELLQALTDAKVMSTIQRVIVKKGIIALRAAS